MDKLEKIIDGQLYVSYGDGWKLVEGPEGEFVTSLYKTLKIGFNLEKTSKERGHFLADLCEKTLRDEGVY